MGLGILVVAVNLENKTMVVVAEEILNSTGCLVK